MLLFILSSMSNDTFRFCITFVLCIYFRHHARHMYRQSRLHRRNNIRGITITESLVHVKLNPGLPWQEHIQQEDDCYDQHSGLKLKEETSEMLHLKYSFVWRWNLDTSESRSEIPVSFEMCYCRRMEITGTVHVGNEEVLQTVKERNILHTTKRRKANWIGHILRRNCLLKHITEEERGRDTSIKTRKKT
jgi:hypothetical protein